MSEEYTFKIIVAGDGGVGKTTLLKRYIENRFEESHKMTIGVDVFTKKMKCYDRIKSILSIWDLGGQKRFQFFLDSFTKGADGIIYCFDLSRLSSFENLWWWREIIKKHDRDQMPSVLVGTKSDIVFENIPLDLIEDYVSRHKLLGFFETSAKLGLNIDKAFDLLNRGMIRHYRTDIENDITDIAIDSETSEEVIKEEYIKAMKKEFLT